LTKFVDRRLLAGVIARSTVRIHAAVIRKMLYFSSHFSKSLEEIYFIKFRSEKLRIRLMY